MRMESLSNRDLEHLFRLRREFLVALRRRVPAAVRDMPVDPTDKDSQIFLRETTLRGVEEMFEALATLKNGKVHRQSEIREFDREHFLEEVVDAFNYFFNVLLYLGVTPEEFVEAYEKKHRVILRRVEEGY
jgi:hypothetical protein